MDLEEVVHRSTSAHNSIERVEGYAPTQWAFGRLPTWTGQLFDDEVAELATTGNEKFKQNLDRQTAAQHIRSLKIMRSMASRAANARKRKKFVLALGMLVCVWRT